MQRISPHVVQVYFETFLALQHAFDFFILNAKVGISLRTLLESKRRCRDINSEGLPVFGLVKFGQMALYLKVNGLKIFYLEKM